MFKVYREIMKRLCWLCKRFLNDLWTKYEVTVQPCEDLGSKKALKACFHKRFTAWIFIGRTPDASWTLTAGKKMQGWTVTFGLIRFCRFTKTACNLDKAMVELTVVTRNRWSSVTELQWMDLLHSVLRTSNRWRRFTQWTKLLRILRQHS